MPRQPEGPRYRAERDAWVCKIDGSLVQFGKGGSKQDEAAAKRAFRKFMVERDERIARGEDAKGRGAPAPTVGLILARFLTYMKSRRDRKDVAARTHSDYVGRLSDFPYRYGHLPADELTPDHVEEWLASKGDRWGNNRRGDAIAVLKTAFRWAVKRKLIAANPIAEGLDKPQRKLRRDRIPTREEIAKFLAAIDLPEFRPFAEFVGLTGCRPSEAARAEARHYDRERGVIRLPEHKTEKKTYRPRVIPLPAAAVPIVEAAAKGHPTGPIFRNSRGNPWERSAWRNRVKAAREKAGLDPEIVLYGFRHSWFTEGLKRTGDLAGMAAAGGHADPSTTARVYSFIHEDYSHLRSLAEQASSSPAPHPAPPASPGQGGGGPSAGPAPDAAPGEASPPEPPPPRPGRKPARKPRRTKPDPSSAPPAAP